MTKHDMLKARIRKLRQMTTARGCTEAEAMAAAGKAAELMREAGLADHHIEAEEVGHRATVGIASVRQRLWNRIAVCTNTAIIALKKRNCVEIVFVGYGGGPEIADYLRVVCDRAVDRGVRDFKKSAFYRRRRSLRTKRQSVFDFTEAMIWRLSMKLDALFADQMNDVARQAAVRLRDELYKTAISTRVRGRGGGHFEARDHGFAAGERVNLSHGMNRGAAAKRIGAGQ